MTNHPLPWIKHIESALAEATHIPLWEGAPAFPWEAFSLALAKTLGVEEISIANHKTHWISEKDLLSSLGKNPKQSSIEISPLGTVHWIMAAEDIAKITNALLSPTSPTKGFSDPGFQEGFYQFLLLKALYSLDSTKAFSDLQPRLIDLAELPKEETLAVDVSISLKNQTLWGRLVFPPAWRETLRKHYGQKKVDIFAKAKISPIEVIGKLEAGSCSLPLSTWEKVKAGDFLILDRCSYDPHMQKGTFTLVLENTPLFTVKAKKGELKILNYASHNEEGTVMSDDYLPEEEPMEENLPEENLEEEAFSEEEETPSWDTKPAGPLISPREIPINLVVEVDRIRISLDKLLQLEPGNVLELSMRPEQGVNVTVGGKRVARAEIVKLGETLGLKILEIGE